MGKAKGKSRTPASESVTPLLAPIQLEVWVPVREDFLTRLTNTPYLLYNSSKNKVQRRLIRKLLVKPHLTNLPSFASLHPRWRPAS
jgi:hypothetical protein